MNYRDYSPGINPANLLAPAITQSLAFLLILSKTTTNGTLLLRKTLSLCSFHTSQETRRVMEAMALRFLAPSPAMYCHHSEMVKFIQSCCVSSDIPNHYLTAVHKRVVKRQWTKRWSTVFTHCLHRGQGPQFGHPLFANRSAVHNLF